MSKASPTKLNANDVFNLIRGQEVNFPFPVKKRTVTVGTFDAATGRFAYSVPTFTEEFEPPDGAGPVKPQKPLKGGVVNAIGAIEVALRFRIKNRKGDAAVSIPGLPVVRAAADTLTVSVGAAESVEFTVSNNNKSFTSELPLGIIRFTVGAGVFELPALPIAIIYAPPEDRSQKNVSKWTASETTGNTTSISVSDKKTTTRPAAVFSNASAMGGAMRGMAKFLDALTLKFNSPEVKGIIKGLNLIADGLGSVSATESEGVSVTEQGSVRLSVGTQKTISTNPASGGPGSGDLIHYLKDVKLAWYAESVGRIRVTVLGHGGIAATTVGLLKSGGETDLDPETTAEFLKLDPFVASGPSASLPPERFVLLETIDLNGGDISLTETYTVTTENSTQTTATRTRVEKSQPGFLKFLGLGVTDEGSVETVVTHSSAVGSSESRTISNSIQLFARPDERYVVELYCDVIFGTFAYRQVRPSPRPLLEGTVSLGDGKALAGRVVTMFSDGRKYTTRTDASGRYAFHARGIRPGRFEVSVGGVKRTRTLAPGKTKFDLEV
ncbi:MAG TPA: carboxypeptidase-like regulatory domain-containing protein [Pyrinomonadaceae bacterium]|nr:carboxypeptidase-like regulatory domain-containing protein [Pyrinomonadaceae bacterium]